MALDTTVAGAAANSYLSVADADARAALDLGRDVDTWLSDDTTDAMKEAALVRATADLDAYKRNASEAAYSDTQALRFPRSTDVASSTPFLAERLLAAAWAQAKYRLDNRDALADARTRRARGFSSFSDDDGGATMSLHTELEPISVEAQLLMDDVLGTVGVGGRRPGFRAMTLSTLSDSEATW